MELLTSRGSISVEIYVIMGFERTTQRQSQSIKIEEKIIQFTLSAALV